MDYLQELVCQFHQEVTVEYVKRLLKRQVKLKDEERQLQAHTTVKGDAESLHSLFSEMVRIQKECINMLVINMYNQ